MVKLRCPKCGHVWNYKGQSKFYATCPRCYHKVNIKKYRVKKRRKKKRR